MAAIGRVLLIPKGTYSGSATYNQLDWVRYDSKAWVCKVNGTVGVTPTEGDNWTLMAADGSVSGSVAWSAVSNKPFATLDSNDFDVDANDELNIKRDTFGTVRVVSGGTTTNLEASGDSVFEIDAGTNVTITADDSANPKKITINSSGGGGGSSTLSGLSDVNISSASNDQVLKYDSSSSKWVNGTAPQGGHTMNPLPSSDPSDSAFISAINTVLVSPTGNQNDEVASLYGIGIWSNTFTRRYFVQATAQHPFGNSGIGTWDDPTFTRWLEIADLKGILSRNDVRIEFGFDSDTFTDDPPVFRGREIEDYDSDDTKNYGVMAIKFANEISDADKVKGRIVIDFIYSREAPSIISP